MEDNGNIVIYEAEGGDVRLDVRLENDTVWLTQEQLSALYSKSLSTINYHINNIFKEGELDKEVVFRKIRITTPHGAIDGLTQESDLFLYNLDVIISVGYRVKSIPRKSSIAKYLTFTLPVSIMTRKPTYRLSFSNAFRTRFTMQSTVRRPQRLFIPGRMQRKSLWALPLSKETARIFLMPSWPRITCPKKSYVHWDNSFPVIWILRSARPSAMN